jgi:hypothetical protein
MIEKCPICNANQMHYMDAVVIKKYEANFFLCENCGFLQIKSPHWLEEAYTNVIASTDTGLVSRNIHLAKKLTLLLILCFGERGKGQYVDIAGGYGMLVRIMRDYGFNFYWKDEYCENLLASGFEHSESGIGYQAITAIEVMEHLEDPLGFVRASLADAKSDTFIFTTSLFNNQPPEIDKWRYYSLETGQHIGFFRHDTLEKMAEVLNMNFFSYGGIHVFTKKSINTGLAKICCSSKISTLASYPISKIVLDSLTYHDHEYMVELIKNL